MVGWGRTEYIVRNAGGLVGRGRIRYPRPTIHPTTSYTELFIYPTPSSTTFFVLHWIVQPSYLMLSRPTTIRYSRTYYKHLPYHTSYHVPSYLMLPRSAFLTHHYNYTCTRSLRHPTTFVNHPFLTFGPNDLKTHD